MALLRVLNAHPRDARIKFDPVPHIYYVDNKKISKSVTGVVHGAFPGFDQQKVANNVFRKSFNDETSKYYGMSVEQIIQSWEVKKNAAANKGSALHDNIDRYFNKLSHDSTTTEFGYFKNFLKDNPDLVPFRTEWEIFDEKLDIAGSIDLITINSDNTYNIVDWKCCEEIPKYNSFESGNFPLEHLPNSKFWHYAFQLNTYKYILEQNYDIKVKQMMLVQLHESKSNYVKHQVPHMDNELEDFIESYKTN